MFLRVPHVLNLLLNFFLLKATLALEWRVFEGEDLQYDVHSYLVKLEFRGNGGLSVNECSGSIISASWIVTAAHCINSNLRSVLVIHSTKNGLRLIADVKKWNIFRHPDFVPNNKTDSNKQNDIALLRLKQQIVFDDHIKPMKLSARRPKLGQSATIAGYGQTEGYLDPPREGAVMISRCHSDLANNICTRGAVRAGPGDSGGPLIYKGALAGVISSGCRDVEINQMCLTVYSSVALKSNWIKRVTNDTVEWIE